MELNSLEELLNDNLKDIYNAENQLLKALPKMSKNASSDSLRDALDNHLQETEMQVKRLEQIGEILGVKLTGKKCMAMEGLIEEGSEVLKSKGEDAVLDLGLIGAAQRVEHYEISAYGTARTFAERLGMSDVAELLQESLDEEEAADKMLTQISEEELLSESPRSNGKRGKSIGAKLDQGSANGKRGRQAVAGGSSARRSTGRAAGSKALSGRAAASRAKPAAARSGSSAKAKKSSVKSSRPKTTAKSSASGAKKQTGRSASRKKK